jgi:hypothetical protein
MRAMVVLVGVLGASAAVTTAAADEKKACTEAYVAAQTLRDQHRLLAARDQLRICARKECSANMQGLMIKDCTDWLAQVEATIPSIVFEATDGHGNDLSAVKVTIDGHPLADKLDGSALQVDPGKHRFAFDDADGLAQVESTIVVREGDKDRRVRVTFGTSRSGVVTPAQPKTPDGASGTPTAAWVILGVGAAGVIAGSVFGVMALNDGSHLNTQTGCPKACPNTALPQIDTLHRDQWASDIGLGVGVIGLGVGVVLLLTSHGPEAAPAAVSLDVGPGVVLLGGRF